MRGKNHLWITLTLLILLATSIACGSLLPAGDDEAAEIDTSPPDEEPLYTPAPTRSFSADSDEQEQGETSEEESQPTPEPIEADANPAHGAAGSGDPLFPRLGNGGYDAQHYTLDLDIDMDNNVIDGIVTLEATATHDLARFNLDFNWIGLKGVVVNGAEADAYIQDGELIITPVEAIQQGDNFETIVTYSGTPNAGDPDAPQYTRGWHYMGDAIMVAGEPSGAANIFPVNEHPSDKATYTFNITVDDAYLVAANGTLENTIEADGKTTYMWEMRDPMASYLATIAVGDFIIETDETRSGVPVRNYYEKGIPEDMLANFQYQPEMLDFFETVFGPYPFDAYGAVVFDTDLAFALETQTLAVFGRSFTDEFVVSHELAHMWFGDSISPATWGDVWLNEGFATYGSVLWNEHKYGEQAVLGELTYYYGFINATGGQTIELGDPPADDLFNRVMYFRGALTLHVLRLEVGDDTFFTILQEFSARYRDGNASIEDFITVSEEVSEQELDDLFNAWLYQAQVPDIPELDLYRDDFS